MVKDLFFGSGVSDFMFGSFVGILVALGITAIVLLSIALYVYFSLSWMRIAKKLKYKNYWFAWIPIVNLFMMLRLGGFNGWWVLLVLIPFLGWFALGVLIVISTWKIFEKRKYPGWFSLSMIIPQVGGILYLIALGFVAWKDKR